MRPILSATEMYNYKLGNWLDDKLEPLSVNKFTITDPLKFAEELRKQKIGEDDLLVSYDVSSLFTNVPVDEFEYVFWSIKRLKESGSSRNTIYT